jgi:hypothetical protein
VPRDETQHLPLALHDMSLAFSRHSILHDTFCREDALAYRGFQDLREARCHQRYRISNHAQEEEQRCNDSDSGLMSMASVVTPDLFGESVLGPKEVYRCARNAVWLGALAKSGSNI